MIEHYGRHLKLTSRIAERESRKSPLWWLVSALVGILTLNSLTLDFVWLLYMSY